MSSRVITYKPAHLGLRLSQDEKGGAISLTLDNGEGDYTPIKHPWVSSQYLEGRLIAARRFLSTWASRYNELLTDPENNRVLCGGELTHEMWRVLAVWGWSLYRDLFDLQGEGEPRLITWAEQIRNNLPFGSRIVIDSSVADLPWGLLYDREPPDHNSQNFLEDVTGHFWGLKYQLESVKFFAEIVVMPKHTLNNADGTRLSVTINKEMDDEYGTKHMAFFERLANSSSVTSAISDPLTTVAKENVRISTAKDQVINSLIQRQEPQHLYYYFCHHSKGDGTYIFRGYRQFEESKMVVTGKLQSPETTVGFFELKDNCHIKKFECPPVVFMNACESAQCDSGNPSGFLFYFTYMLSARAFIGTEAPIPASFADEFGRSFIESFLKGESVGQILFDLNCSTARENGNPFGLYYTLHGNGNTRLSQPFR